jgi:serine/threonine protein kinase
MNDASNGRQWPRLGHVVEAYEAALANDGRAALTDFVPPPEHPDRLSILCELIRVDLEHRWERGELTRLEEYKQHYPSVFEDREFLYAMAYEEFRLRQQAGEQPTPAEYQRRFGLEVGDWPIPGQPEAKSAGVVDTPSGLNHPGEPGEGMARAASAYGVYRRSGTGQAEELELQFRLLDVPREQAELLRTLDRMAPQTAQRLAEAVCGLPRVGTDFLGFRLCGELGRGAFGRVYLARQGDLADRLVALKVSADVGGESHALAQLQHTNIVPIYSVHRRRPLQAVCMPYLGATTLADTLSDLRSQAALPRSGDGLLSTLHSRKSAHVQEASAAESSAGTEKSSATSRDTDVAMPHDQVGTSPLVVTPQIQRLRGMGYVAAVLWLMARVSEGLAHAHERGILHRDLKPANILFTDDGEPVLLDFNLAADTKARLRASFALIGGTLPYMAPEQLRAFHAGDDATDARSDIYALGVIFYELLTSAHPFPLRDGPVDAILPEMIADRLKSPPDVTAANPAVSPAVASILQHCLEPDLSRRYQTARELQEDLQRQLDDLPLRHIPEPSVRERFSKWARRHPRLTSSTTVGLVSMLLLLSLATAFFVRNRHYERLDASTSFNWLENERRQAIALLSPPFADPAQSAEGLAHCRNIADRYAIFEDPAWFTRPRVERLEHEERSKLRQAVGDTLVLWARTLIRRSAAEKEQDRAEGLAAAARQLDLAEQCFGPGMVPRALVLARADLVRQTEGEGSRERDLRAQAQSIPLRTVPEQLLIEDLDRIDPDLRRQLVVDQEGIVASDPQNWAVWVALGNWNVRLRRIPAARTAFSVAIALAPRLWAPYYSRGLLDLEVKDNSQALEDFDHVIALRSDLANARLNRALAKLGLGDAKGAEEDLTVCLGLKGAPSRTWFVRAEARRRLGKFEGARQDREEGLKRQPDEAVGFVSRGLARLPLDPQGALADFDAALAIDPFDKYALQNKASVLGENLGRGEEALKVLDVLLLHHPETYEAICGRGVQLARFGRREPALRDARAALSIDDSAQTIYQVACIYSLLSQKDNGDAREAIRLLAQAFRKDGLWLEIARKDPDMAPIRNQPDFQGLLEACEKLIRAGTKPSGGDFQRRPPGK